MFRINKSLIYTSKNIYILSLKRTSIILFSDFSTVYKWNSQPILELDNLTENVSKLSQNEINTQLQKLHQKIEVNSESMFNFINSTIYYGKPEFSCYLYKKFLQNTQIPPILLESIFIASIDSTEFEISKILLPKVHLTVKMLDKVIRKCNFNDDFSLLTLYKPENLKLVASFTEIEDLILEYLTNPLTTDNSLELYKLYRKSGYQPTKILILSLLKATSTFPPLYKYIYMILDDFKSFHFKNGKYISVFPKIFFDNLMIHNSIFEIIKYGKYFDPNALLSYFLEASVRARNPQYGLILLSKIKATTPVQDQRKICALFSLALENNQPTVAEQYLNTLYTMEFDPFINNFYEMLVQINTINNKQINSKFLNYIKEISTGDIHTQNKKAIHLYNLSQNINVDQAIYELTQTFTNEGSPYGFLTNFLEEYFLLLSRLLNETDLLSIYTNLISTQLYISERLHTLIVKATAKNYSSYLYDLYDVNNITITNIMGIEMIRYLKNPKKEIDKVLRKIQKDDEIDINTFYVCISCYSKNMMIKEAILTYLKLPYYQQCLNWRRTINILLETYMNQSVGPANEIFHYFSENNVVNDYITSLIWILVCVHFKLSHQSLHSILQKIDIKPIQSSCNLTLLEQVRKLIEKNERNYDISFYPYISIYSLVSKNVF